MAITRVNTFNGNVVASASSIASQPIGTAASDRIVWVVGYSTGSGANISGITIGGVAATFQFVGDASFDGPYIAWAKVPTGTTATVALTRSGGTTNSIYVNAIYAIYGAKLPAVAYGISINPPVSPQSVAVVAGGLVVAHSSSEVVNPSFTGLTQDDEDIADGYYETSASALMGASGTLSLGSNADFMFMWTSFEPAGGYTLAANGATLALSSPAVALKVSRKLGASGRTLSLTGQAVSLRRGYTLAAQGRSLSLAAGAVGLVAGRKLTAQGRVLSITGQPVGLALTRKIQAESASLSLTGQAVTLTYVPISGYTLSAAGAVLALSGGSVALKVSRRFDAGSRTMTLAAGDVGLKVSRKLSVGGATIALTTPAVTIRRAKTMAAGGATISLSAGAVGLRVGRALQAGGVAFTVWGGDVNLRILRAPDITVSPVVRPSLGVSASPVPGVIVVEEVADPAATVSATVRGALSISPTGSRPSLTVTPR